jgi:hypothetical protein
VDKPDAVHRSPMAQAHISGQPHIVKTSLELGEAPMDLFKSALINEFREGRLPKYFGVGIKPVLPMRPEPPEEPEQGEGSEDGDTLYPDTDGESAVYVNGETGETWYKYQVQVW